MIIDFSIQNYRGIKDKVTLSFEPENSNRLEDFYLMEPIPGYKLLKLGIIYGPNGSGKTTILEALDFLRSLIITPATQKQQKLAFEPFLFDNVSRNTPTIFELNFISGEHKYLYEISFNKHAVLIEKLYFHHPNKALVFERNTDTEKQLSSIRFGSKIKMKKAEEDTLITNTLWNTTVLGSFLKTNIDSVELREATKWFLVALNSLVTPDTDLFARISSTLTDSNGNKQNVLLFMQKADFGITNISVEKNEQKPVDKFNELINSLTLHAEKQLDFFDITIMPQIDIKFEHAIRNEDKIELFSLPYGQESQGTKRYFQFSGLLNSMLKHSKVFTIDELESSLHPDLLKHFLLLFLVNVKSSQLIVTTHYRELLMEKDILREDAIWFTEKKTTGGIDLYSLSDFDSSVIRDTSSIFNAYKSGKLGAVPTLSDYYINIPNEEKE